MRKDFGSGLYLERRQGSIGESLFSFRHKCHIMLQLSLDTNATVYKDRHFSCEDCDGTVSGGFDAATSQIVLCQNNIHETARVDWFNSFRHLACSEIRAVSLSGDCSFVNEISRFNFGLKEHHQVCVRGRALRSILAVCKVSREEAELVVDEVFDSCFHDHAPFTYRDYENRDRYYANL
uniref:Mitochondrial inner membrane protease ATP23 n=1 Tax=Cyprinus carpio carpio TaxID=630221 RepID=A0A9J7YG46_CYPCA